MQDDKPVKPFDGERNLRREQLAKYLNRLGRGINCRMDVPILVIEDIRWAATVFERLAKQLGELGFTDDRSDIWRIMEARMRMEQARAELAKTNQRRAGQKTSRKLSQELPR